MEQAHFCFFYQPQIRGQNEVFYVAILNLLKSYMFLNVNAPPLGYWLAQSVSPSYKEKA